MRGVLLLRGNMIYVDANILLRFILKDNEEMAKKAETAIIESEVYVLPEVFAEVVYVLNSVYNTERNVISNYMLNLLNFVETDDSAIMTASFMYYGETTLDFVDCVLAAYNLILNKEIWTFDKKLNNFIKRKRNTQSAGEYGIN